MVTIVYCFGYTLIFGPILAKMWRIYYIFHNPSPKKKVCAIKQPLLVIIITNFMQNITDWHLGIFIAIVVSIVVVLLVIGFSIPATIPRAFTSPDGEYQNVSTIIDVILKFSYICKNKQEDGIRQTSLIVKCFPLPSILWTLTLYLYLAVLQVLEIKSLVYYELLFF